MYAANLSEHGGAAKPELTEFHMQMRCIVARKLKARLLFAPETLIFIDAASMRLHEPKDDTCWHTPEWEHPDVKKATQKNHDYSCGQFFGGISYGRRPAP